MRRWTLCAGKPKNSDHREILGGGCCDHHLEDQTVVVTCRARRDDLAMRCSGARRAAPC